MATITLILLLPPDNRELTVELDDSLTSSDIVEELITAGQLQPSPQGYEVAAKGGAIFDADQTVSQSGLSDGSRVRLIPIIEAGGYPDIIPLLRQTIDYFAPSIASGAIEITLIRVVKDVVVKYLDTIGRRSAIVVLKDGNSIQIDGHMSNESVTTLVRVLQRDIAQQ